MIKHFLFILCFCCVVVLTGCMSMHDRPNAWQSGYQYSSTAYKEGEVPGEAGFQFIEPTKCRLTLPLAETQTRPLGCANDKNLQHMVERTSDLITGQEMGPARAAPIAAAARQRLAGSRSDSSQDTTPPTLNTTTISGGL